MTLNSTDRENFKHAYAEAMWLEDLMAGIANSAGEKAVPDKLPKAMLDELNRHARSLVCHLTAVGATMDGQRKEP